MAGALDQCRDHQGTPTDTVPSVPYLWMYQYAGGLRPMQETPGFRTMVIQPCFVKQLQWVKMSHKSPYGEIRIEWKRTGKQIECKFEIPKGCEADIVLPGKTVRNAGGSFKLQAACFN